MNEFDFPRKCCNARYCPLVTAWATTVHKLQGFEAGFVSNDRMNYIIADVGTLEWEKKNPGTAYTVAGRAKTIGTFSPDNPYPQNLNLFFDGTLGGQYFSDGNKKVDGEECVQFQNIICGYNTLNNESGRQRQMDLLRKSEQ